MDELFLWIKVLHIVAVIAWMAGLLYLPRLFVYHVTIKPCSTQSDTFKLMERRLLRAIMNPAMGLVWISGLLLVYLGQYWSEPWFWAKFVCVVVLSDLHYRFGRNLKMFEENQNTKSEKFFRVINEVPTVALIAIVIFVVIKPF